MTTWLQGEGNGNNGNNYIGSGAGAGNASWDNWMHRWHCGVGSATITNVKFRHALTEDVDDGKIRVYSRDPATNIHTMVAEEDVAITATTSTVAASFDLGMNVATSSGLEYYVALCMHRTASAASGRPGMRRITSSPTVTTSGDFRRYQFKDSDYSGTMPSSFDGDTANVNQVLGASSLSASITWESGAGVVFSDESVSLPLGIAHPRPTSTSRSFVVLKSVVVPDGDTLTVDFRNDTSSVGTLVIDMGATDQVTFLTNNVTLPTINSLSQGGDTFDFAIGFEPDGGGFDVYWVNRSKGTAGLDTSGTSGYRDIGTRSHESARSGSRNQTASIGTEPKVVHIDGTGSPTVGSVEVVDASAMFVMLGDSQVGSKSGTSPAFLHRIGSEFGDLIDGVTWNAAISGGRFDSDVSGASTAGKTRYNGTTGTNDLIEMVKKSGAVLVYAGMGLNDISAGVSDAATAVSVPAAMQTALDTILADMGNGSVVLLGLPPYSAVAADTHESDAIRNLNAELLESSISYGTPFSSPWRAMWDRSKNGNDAYVFTEAYTSDSGTHYGAAGTAGPQIAAERLLNATLGERSEDGNRLGTEAVLDPVRSPVNRI